MPESNKNDNPTPTNNNNEPPQGAASSKQTPAPTDEGSQTEGGKPEDFYAQTPSSEKPPEKIDSKEGEVVPPSSSGYSEKDPKPPEGAAAKPAEGDPSSASGYGEEPPPEKPPVEKPPEDPAPVEGDFKIDEVGELLPEEVKSLTDFVNKHKIPKEAADALVAEKKAEIKKGTDGLAAQDQARKDKLQSVKLAYHKELKTDADFGGEQFGFNIKRVDKVIDDFMPGLKKQLTDSKAMLPPYVMKDLAKLANHLYGSKPLVQGDPPVPKPKEEDEDPLAFYNS